MLIGRLNVVRGIPWLEHDKVFQDRCDNPSVFQTSAIEQWRTKFRNQWASIPLIFLSIDSKYQNF